MEHTKEAFKYNHNGQLVKHVTQHLEGTWLTEIEVVVKYHPDKDNLILKRASTKREANMHSDDIIEQWVEGDELWTFEE